MKKFMKLTVLSVLALTVYTHANALITEKSNDLSDNRHVTVTSFLDYPPFGKIVNRGLELDTVYQPFIDTLQKEGHPVDFRDAEDYETSILNVLNNEVDILLGAYFDTEIYQGIELLYPSILNNPIVPVTMPDKELNIKNKGDLANLKGGYDKREYFSDYVNREIKKLNIQEFDDTYKLYEQLFIGNIDYILTSRYYGALQQADLGIRDMVNMSKHTLWDMPLFVGISGVKLNNKLLANTVKKILKENQDDLKKQIEQQIIETVRKADEASRGRVPPSFVK